MQLSTEYTMLNRAAIQRMPPRWSLSMFEKREWTSYGAWRENMSVSV